jgi:antirestriction protein ArdC
VDDLPAGQGKRLAVGKGEKSTPIFFYKPLEIEDEATEDGTKTIPILKSFPVFHSSQVDGVPAYIPPSIEEAAWRRPEAAEIILKNRAPVIR